MADSKQEVAKAVEFVNTISITPEECKKVAEKVREREERKREKPSASIEKPFRKKLFTLRPYSS